MEQVRGRRDTATATDPFEHEGDRHIDFAYQRDDTLLVGRESDGVPPSVHARADAQVRVPMQADTRSLNVVTALALVLGEALRQQDGFTD